MKAQATSADVTPEIRVETSLDEAMRIVEHASARELSGWNKDAPVLMSLISGGDPEKAKKFTRQPLWQELRAHPRFKELGCGRTVMNHLRVENLRPVIPSEVVQQLDRGQFLALLRLAKGERLVDAARHLADQHVRGRSAIAYVRQLKNDGKAARGPKPGLSRISKSAEALANRLSEAVQAAAGDLKGKDREDLQAIKAAFAGGQALVDAALVGADSQAVAPVSLPDAPENGKRYSKMTAAVQAVTRGDVYADHDGPAVATENLVILPVAEPTQRKTLASRGHLPAPSAVGGMMAASACPGDTVRATSAPPTGSGQRLPRTFFAEGQVGEPPCGGVAVAQGSGGSRSEATATVTSTGTPLATSATRHDAGTESDPVPPVRKGKWLADRVRVTDQDRAVQPASSANPAQSAQASMEIAAEAQARAGAAPDPVTVTLGTDGVTDRQTAASKGRRLPQALLDAVRVTVRASVDAGAPIHGTASTSKFDVVDGSPPPAAKGRRLPQGASDAAKAEGQPPFLNTTATGGSVAQVLHAVATPEEQTAVGREQRTHAKKRRLAKSTDSGRQPAPAPRSSDLVEGHAAAGSVAEAAGQAVSTQVPCAVALEGVDTMPSSASPDPDPAEIDVGLVEALRLMRADEQFDFHPITLAHKRYMPEYVERAENLRVHVRSAPDLTALAATHGLTADNPTVAQVVEHLLATGWSVGEHRLFQWPFVKWDAAKACRQDRPPPAWTALLESLHVSQYPALALLSDHLTWKFQERVQVLADKELASGNITEAAQAALARMEPGYLRRFVDARPSYRLGHFESRMLAYMGFIYRDGLLDFERYKLPADDWFARGARHARCP